MFADGSNGHQAWPLYNKIGSSEVCAKAVKTQITNIPRSAALPQNLCFVRAI
jgi:hypothetical protein